MKRLLTLVLSLAALSAAFAQAPAIVLWRYQVTAPTFNAQGDCTSALVNGMFGYYSANLVTGKQELSQCGQADFDLVALGSTSVTASGVTVTYAQLAALNAAACQQQWNASPSGISSPAMITK